MPDRYVLNLPVSVASNIGAALTWTAWARRVVPWTGTLRSVYAVASSISSNTAQNTVDVFRQPDAPAGGSNTAATVLVSPITLTNTLDAVSGTIRAGNDRVNAGDTLEVRIASTTVAAIASFRDLDVSVEVERDAS